MTAQVTGHGMCPLQRLHFSKRNCHGFVETPLGNINKEYEPVQTESEPHSEVKVVDCCVILSSAPFQK